MLASPLGAAADPPGNNGTVKIEQIRADGIPQNNPHQTCELRVEWYGFDEGDDVISQVSFDAMAPTSGSSISVAGDTRVPVGADAASGAGTDTGLDGSEVYTLSFTGEPHAQQGYHVKVTVHTPYSLGNDSKSKVFWVEPCASGGGSGTAARTAPTGTDAPAAGSSVLPTEQSVGGGSARAGNDDGPQVPTAVDAGGDDTDGTPATVPFGLLALGSAVAAAAVHLRRRATLD